jgi:hypothetical protein
VRLNPFLINIAGEGAEARYFTAISKPSLTNRTLFMIIIPIMADNNMPINSRDNGGKAIRLSD